MTSPVFLRELERSDLQKLNAWRSDRTLVGQLGAPFRHVSVEIDQRWFDGYLASRQSNVRLAVCDASTRDMLGVVYLLDIDWIHRGAEFAIQIGEPSARGRGIGTEATRLALDHAFLDLNLARIHLTVLASNSTAIALYEKAGFRAEGLFRQAAFKDGQRVDLISMAMLADERPPRR